MSGAVLQHGGTKPRGHRHDQEHHRWPRGCQLEDTLRAQMREAPRAMLPKVRGDSSKPEPGRQSASPHRLCVLQRKRASASLTTEQARKGGFVAEVVSEQLDTGLALLLRLAHTASWMPPLGPRLQPVTWLVNWSIWALLILYLVESILPSLLWSECYPFCRPGARPRQASLNCS